MFNKTIEYKGSVTQYFVLNTIFNALLAIGFILEITFIAYLMMGLIWFLTLVTLWAITNKHLIDVSLNDPNDSEHSEMTMLVPVSFFTRTIIDTAGLAILLYSGAIATAIGYCLYVASRESLSKWVLGTIEELKEKEQEK